jgi:hypothetical protein
MSSSSIRIRERWEVGDKVVVKVEMSGVGISIISTLMAMWSGVAVRCPSPVWRAVST